MRPFNKLPLSTRSVFYFLGVVSAAIVMALSMLPVVNSWLNKLQMEDTSHEKQSGGH